MDPAKNSGLLSRRKVEDNYGDYVTYQVIDAANLFIPAQRMLLKERNSLWDQIFVSKEEFIEVKQEKNTTKDPKKKSTTTKTKNQSENAKLLFVKAQQEKVRVLIKQQAKDSPLTVIGECFYKESNPLCKAWVNEIFPDWRQSSLSNIELSKLFSAPLLFFSELFFLGFGNYNFLTKCLMPLEVDDPLRSPGCDVAVNYNSSMLRFVTGLLYGQMAFPSFPVIDKLLRLKYTAKTRQMFADVVIFDKCRYLYEQFSSVDCALFALLEPKQQIVLRIVADGMGKNVGGACWCDVFEACKVSKKLPERQKIEFPQSEEKENCLVEATGNAKPTEGYDESMILHPCKELLGEIICANITRCLSKFEHVPCAANGNARNRRAMITGELQEYRKAVRDLIKGKPLETIDTIQPFGSEKLCALV